MAAAATSTGQAALAVRRATWSGCPWSPVRWPSVRSSPVRCSSMRSSPVTRSAPGRPAAVAAPGGRRGPCGILARARALVEGGRAAGRVPKRRPWAGRPPPLYS